MKKKIWFITGISSGLGKALAEAVIQKGDFVIGTLRTQEAVDTFNTTYQDKALAVLMDVTRDTDIQNAFQLIEARFGYLDILVNNAGFGFAGAIEEASEQEIRAVFEANFLGALKITQKALPILRKQKSGHIIQISSHGGFKAMPGFGIYNASKFALEGFSEALASEIAPLGIKLTIVEPGPFRTGFAGNSFKLAEKVITDYQATAGIFREKIKQVDGKQEGDPEKAALAIIEITSISNPPLRLPLGKIALNTLYSKLDSVRNDLEKWAKTAEESVFLD